MSTSTLRPHKYLLKNALNKLIIDIKFVLIGVATMNLPFIKPGSQTDILINPFRSYYDRKGERNPFFSDLTLPLSSLMQLIKGTVNILIQHQLYIYTWMVYPQNQWYKHKYFFQQLTMERVLTMLLDTLSDIATLFFKILCSPLTLLFALTTRQLATFFDSDIKLSDDQTKLIQVNRLKADGSLELPDHVTHIGGFVLRGRDSLTRIHLPTNLSEIGNNAFSWCSKLTKVTVPNGTLHIGRSVFRGCTSLIELNLPDSITHFGDNVFDQCGIPQIILPNSIISIQNGDLLGQCPAKILIDTSQIDEYNRIANLLAPSSASHLVPFELNQAILGTQRAALDSISNELETAPFFRVFQKAFADGTLPRLPKDILKILSSLLAKDDNFYYRVAKRQIFALPLPNDLATFESDYRPKIDRISYETLEFVNSLSLNPNTVFHTTKKPLPNDPDLATEDFNNNIMPLS